MKVTLKLGDKKQEIVRPTVDQIAWVLQKLDECYSPSGRSASFRYVLYEAMGLDQDAYTPVYLAGGQNVTNLLCDAAHHDEDLERIVAAVKNYDEHCAASGLMRPKPLADAMAVIQARGL